MAFYLYDAEVVKQRRTTIRLLLTGAGIPHVVAGKATVQGEVVKIRPRRSRTTDGAKLPIGKGETLFFDPEARKASYDLDTLGLDGR